MAYESLKQIVVKYEKTQSPTSPFAVAIAGGCSGIISLVSVRLSSCVSILAHRIADISSRSCENSLSKSLLGKGTKSPKCEV